jgi:hypothetical protein
LGLILQAEGLGDDHVGRYLRARNQYIRGGLVRAMRIGRERGEIRDDFDVDARAAQVAAFMFGIAHQHFIDPDAVDIVAVYADFVRRLIQAISTDDGSASA